MAKSKPVADNDVGRPTKFTPQRCADIVSAISRRAPYQLAAEANGICERTLFYWLEKGAGDLEHGIDSEYALFLQSIKKAEMEKIMQHTDIIAARPERWQADAWILERRWPKHFGPNAQLNELNERLAKLEGGDNKNDSQEA